MTNEEAIRRIQDHMEIHHIGQYPHIRLAEALGMAILSLQKDTGDSKKCWWCKNYGSVPLRVFTEHGCQSIAVKFCPLCGNRIVEDEE